jgi:hypothetical protein
MNTEQTTQTKQLRYTQVNTGIQVHKTTQIYKSIKHYNTG